MNYELLYTARAKKDIRKLNNHILDRIERGLIAIGEDPARGKPLTGGLKGLWSYPIGKCRVIYRPIKKERVVIIEHVGYRREIYKKKK